MAKLALWHFGSEVEMLVLGDDGKHLPCFDIVSLCNQALFDIAPLGCRDYNAASAAVSFYTL